MANQNKMLPRVWIFICLCLFKTDSPKGIIMTIRFTKRGNEQGNSKFFIQFHLVAMVAFGLGYLVT
ncbi:predicted protein [Sclerotinia sclerotiorum 1980 UF-70]|uniref:Uncharacterized protein n=1 Tax=Sclerotinia sclerotiorum (strain ATCC 18683 / 1980 / Ss-1) TaxID=665079 RepID=A7F2Z4_SCLS1|nr:predicted protein [Sclerotinia sclerotiorum 1980 UF-70]EDN96086.1 predicted protein [Sclerotinia sclerotiorum 1980 UF-70]